MDELHTLKGGTGGDSDGIDLEEVEIIGDPPVEEEEEEEEEEEDPEPEEDPEEPNPWDDPGSWWWGDGPEPDEPDQEEETPCEKAKADGQKAMNILNNSNVQFTVNGSLQYGTSNNVESSFSIRRDQSGNLTTSSVTFGSSGTSVQSQNYADSIAAVHTHPTSISPPSARDFIAMATWATGASPNLQASFVLCQDGTKYAMVIQDRSALESFLIDNADNVNQNHGWLRSEPVGVIFDVALEAFTKQGMSGLDAYVHASAYIVDRAGVTLLKAEPTQAPNVPSEFKKVNAKSEVDSNGVEHFDATDCP